MRIGVCATRRGDAEALDLIDRATVEGPGRRWEQAQPDNSLYYKELDNTPAGTSKEYAIRKLRKDRPDMKECGNAGREGPMDATEYMSSRPRSEAVEDADRAYGDAVDRLRAVVPPEAVRLVLALEEAATAWGVELACAYFAGGVEVGLCPGRLAGVRLDLSA